MRHLESIEAGRFDALHSRTYAIGFAKTFASAADLDPQEIADQVREEMADSYASPAAMVGAMEPGDPAKLPSSRLAWFGGIAAIILAVGIYFFYSTFYGAGANPPSLLAEADESADGADAVDGSASGNGEAGSQPAAPSPQGQVVFTATGEGGWVRFYEQGGERLFEGVMEAGDTFEVPPDAQDPRLNTGRPNLFEVTIGGQTVAPISDVMIPIADVPVSAEALLARTDDSEPPLVSRN